MIQRSHKHREEKTYALPLTPLMDIVTNLLVYTIKIFALSTLVIQDPSVQLPNSTTRKDTEESVIVMVTGTQKIMVEGLEVEQIDPRTYRVPESAKKNGYVITKLKQELLTIKQKRKQSSRVIIVADKQTPYRVLVDVLVTCGDAGYGNFEFAVIKQEA